MYHRVVPRKQTDVSEVHTASIMRAILMMEAVHTSEISLYFHETTRRYIPERCHLKKEVSSYYR
jgi:hypothetical protein